VEVGAAGGVGIAVAVDVAVGGAVAVGRAFVAVGQITGVGASAAWVMLGADTGSASGVRETAGAGTADRQAARNKTTSAK
jgi:hypothetical protein